MNESYMHSAINKAYEGIEKGQSPFGACIVKEGEIIACDHNIVLSSKDITAHAEIHAIRNTCIKLDTIDLSYCEIYSTCEPCPMCFSAIHWARIKKIYFGAGIKDAKRFGFNEINISNKKMKLESGSNIEIIPAFLQKECIELFKYWNSKKNKQVY